MDCCTLAGADAAAAVVLLWPHAAVAHVVGAVVHQLAGPAQQARDLHRLLHRVPEQPAAERAARRQHMHHHLAQRQAQVLRHGLLGDDGALQAGPDLGAADQAGGRVAPHVGDGAIGLHRRV